MTSVGSYGDDSEDVAQEKEVISTPEEVDEGNECRIGMVFKSIEEAEACYRDYGLSNGFSIRRRSTYRSSLRGSDVTGVAFACSCEGAYKMKNYSDDDGKTKRSSSTMRSGCTARMRIRWIKQTKLWEISILEDKHNHALVTPSKRVFLRSNGRMPAAKKTLSKSLCNEYIQHSKIPSFFGDSANVVLDKKDVWNHMRNVKSLYYEEGDVEGVKTYFKKMAVAYPHFYYAIQYDRSGKATNFFWVNARARMAYSRFGDAVTFDTTYRTNKYGMPFAPFTGVNHHGQSIFFGCALLGNEFEGTFVWLFENWLEAMGGQPPISIITNLDLALGIAIAKVFPKTRHRFCLWHIEKKFDEKLSHVFFRKSKFKQAVKRCTRGARTIEEFEEQWVYLLQEYGLEDNEWLKHLYEIREYWIPIYCRDTFFAGMNTTQRSESIDSFFDEFVTSEISLTDFVTKHDQALESIYASERKEDYFSTYKPRVLKTKDFLLAHAANTYTRNMFGKFVEEFGDACRLRVDEREINGDFRTYVLRYKVGGSNEEWVVTFNLATKEGSCGCQLFDFYGIPCKHLMRVCDRLNIDKIPAHFIKKRWTKGANRARMVAPDGLRSRAAKVNDLCKRSTELAYLAAESEMGYKLVLEILNKAYDQIREMNENMLQKQYEGASTSVGIVAQTCTSRVEGILVHPHISQTKGMKRTNEGNKKEPGRSNERIESGLEMCIQKKKPRECKACQGHGHDSRNCKKFPRTKMLHNSETRLDDEITGRSNERIESGLEMSIPKKKPRECKACQGHGHDSRNCKKFPRTKMLHNSKTIEDGAPSEKDEDA